MKTNTNANKEVNSTEVAKATENVIPARTYCQPINDILALINSDAADTNILVGILKIATTNVDETKLPLDQCTDAELNRRLTAVYSKKVPAKKEKDAAAVVYAAAYSEGLDEESIAALLSLVEASKAGVDKVAKSKDEDKKTFAAEALKIAEDNYNNALASQKVMLAAFNKLEKANAAYSDLLAEEEKIKSFKTTTSNRSGVVSTDNVDHSKLSQFELGKVIRNYQSKKSNAKKAMDSAMVGTEEYNKQKGLVEYWQSKVDEATKFRTSGESNKSGAATNNKIAELIKSLEAGPQTPEVATMIASLKVLL